MEKEIRQKGEVRASQDKRTVEGYALLFNVPSSDLPWQETIERGALDGVLDKSDVMCLLNHNEDRGVLARWPMKEGSLHLEVDDRGLLYRFEAPNTALGDELLENIRRGEINESSFAFQCSEDTWSNQDSDNIAEWKRSITKIGQLYDVSPVYQAAYNKTSVYARNVEDKEKELFEIRKKAKEEETKDIHEEPNEPNEPNEEPQQSYYEELEKYINI